MSARRVGDTLRAVRDCSIRVIARPARPGAVKTRLVPPLDADEAADLATALLADTVAICASSGATVDAYRVEHGSLGHALEAALCDALREAPTALVVAPDTIGLTVADLEECRMLLDSADAVLAPAVDGGYYAIGARRPVAGVLGAVPQSTASAARDTARALAAAGFTVAWSSRERADCDDRTGLQALLDGAAGAHVQAALAAMPSIAGRVA